MNKEIIKLIEDLKKINKSFIEEKNKIVSTNKIFKSKFLFFYYFMKSEYFKHSPYRNILINYFNKSEKIFPGSSYYTSVKLLDKLFKNTHANNKVSTDKNLDTLFDYLQSISNEKSFNLLKNILLFSGPDAVINCELTKNKEISVHKNCKPSYNVNIHDSFKSVYFSNSNTTTKTFKVSIFDGFIERESELMPFVEELHKDKIPGIILCRGISDEAASHLKRILLRNRIYLYPYVEKFNNSDPFLFKDIAKNLGTNVVSTEFCDNVYKDIVGKSIDKKLTLSHDKIIFDKKSEDLILELNNQIKDNKNLNVDEYLRKRKARSSPNNITVYIPNSELSLLNELKSLISCYNACATSGFLKDENNIFSKKCEAITDILSESLYNTINNIGLVVKLNEDKK
jgi:hypothetical protein